MFLSNKEDPMLETLGLAFYIGCSTPFHISVDFEADIYYEELFTWEADYITFSRS